MDQESGLLKRKQTVQAKHAACEKLDMVIPC